jgi:hypothetical protein
MVSGDSRSKSSKGTIVAYSEISDAIFTLCFSAYFMAAIFAPVRSLRR